MIIVQIAGHLGSDPEVRFTPSNQKVTSFRVATNIKRGENEKTIWWRVTCWGDRFDKRLAYLRKGSAVIVIGEMGEPKIYMDKSGAQQIALEITAEILSFSPFGKGMRTSTDGAPAVAEAAPTGVSSVPQTTPYQISSVIPGAGQANFADDDIPF